MLIKQINIPVSTGKTDNFESLGQILQIKEQMENELANEVAIQIGIRAEYKLQKTKDRYIQALTVHGSTIILDTEDFVVHLVEEGNKPFDMKVGMLASPKVKIGKDGQKYLVVPIEPESGKFAVVSEKSDSDSWIHPGHQGFHLVDETINTFDMQPVIDKYLEQIL